MDVLLMRCEEELQAMGRGEKRYRCKQHTHAYNRFAWIETLIIAVNIPVVNIENRAGRLTLLPENHAFKIRGLVANRKTASKTPRFSAETGQILRGENRKLSIQTESALGSVHCASSESDRSSTQKGNPQPPTINSNIQTPNPQPQLAQHTRTSATR